MPSRRAFMATALAATALPVLGSGAQAAQTANVLLPQNVSISPEYQVGSIVILPRSYFLYHVVAPGEARRYGIAVARPGLGWTGTATIRRKVEWPTWRPTADMIERDPGTYGQYKDNDERMPGGPGNPLGARALYLFQGDQDTMIRIHGTTQPGSIGRNASSGCFRMRNEHVIELYNQVDLGTPVTVL